MDIYLLKAKDWDGLSSTAIPFADKDIAIISAKSYKTEYDSVELEHWIVDENGSPEYVEDLV